MILDAPIAYREHPCPVFCGATFFVRLNTLSDESVKLADAELLLHRAITMHLMVDHNAADPGGAVSVQVSGGSSGVRSSDN